jgi:hypothetical protein
MAVLSLREGLTQAATIYKWKEKKLMIARKVLTVVFVLWLVLSACVSGSKGNPTDPVNDFLRGFLETQDAEKVANATCKQYREGVRSFLELMVEMQQELEVQADYSVPKTELIDLEYEIISEKKNEALVEITGKLRTIEMGQTSEAALSEGDFATLKVIKEDDNWVVCDERLADFSAEALQDIVDEVFENIIKELESQP